MCDASYVTVFGVVDLLYSRRMRRNIYNDLKFSPLTMSYICIF